MKTTYRFSVNTRVPDDSLSVTLDFFFSTDKKVDGVLVSELFDSFRFKASKQLLDCKTIWHWEITDYYPELETLNKLPA